MFTLKHKEAILPKRQTSHSAGYDLHVIGLEIRDHVIIAETGVVAEIPPHLVGLLFVRSSVAMRLGGGLLNSVGVIDADYRDTIKVMFLNTMENRAIFHGLLQEKERIAQLVMVPYEAFETVGTKRTGGLGSTGKK